MEQEFRKIVLITGGSGGIGRALANTFAREGYDLILVARNIERLRKAKDEIETCYKSRCEIVVIDLSEHNSIYQLYDKIHESNWSIDVLVNNAGFGTWGEFDKMEVHRTEKEIHLNILSLTLLTNLILKDMRKRGSGKIMNIASTAGFQPGPMMAVYYASKAYVLSLSQAIAREVEGSGITVAVVCPGPTHTDFQRNAGMASMHLLKSVFMMDAESVAELAYKGLTKGKKVLIPGVFNNIASFVARFVPKSLLLTIVHSLHKQRS